jgi:hypothetical protein
MASTSRSPRRPRPSPASRRSSGTRFIALDGAVKSVNDELQDKGPDPGRDQGPPDKPGRHPGRRAGHRGLRDRLLPRALADREELPHVKARPEARPVYHGKRESIDARLSVVFAALAVTRFIENRTGWSIRKFVRTARRYRTIQIRSGQHILTAEDPLPPGLRDALTLIK